NLDEDPIPASADPAGQLWIHCSSIAKLIERVSDRDFLNRTLHDEMAQIESWSEYTASPTDKAVVVPALQELQRRLALAHGIASRHISKLLILVTGSGIPLRQLAVDTADCRFGNRDILTTCRVARQIVPGKQLLTERDAHVYGVDIAASDGPLDPVAVLLNALEYDPYIRTLPWYGYDVEPFLLPGGGHTLGGIFARFDMHARSRIVREIEAA
ncbi:hypothetical protein GX586_14360, partial [bacterium]|nr:hypothetical protein [bacterium]